MGRSKPPRVGRSRYPPTIVAMTATGTLIVRKNRRLTNGHDRSATVVT
jgi:hypothetical protein